MNGVVREDYKQNNLTEATPPQAEGGATEEGGDEEEDPDAMDEAVSTFKHRFVSPVKHSGT